MGVWDRNRVFFENRWSKDWRVKFEDLIPIKDDEAHLYADDLDGDFYKELFMSVVEFVSEFAVGDKVERNGVLGEVIWYGIWHGDNYCLCVHPIESAQRSHVEMWRIDECRNGVIVLDADGVEIRSGDTVYSARTGEQMTVLDVSDSSIFPVSVKVGESKRFCDPRGITHKKPDALEDIERDARKTYTEYWGCDGVECCDCPASINGEKPKERYGTRFCTLAIPLDLLARQRKVLERDAK